MDPRTLTAIDKAAKLRGMSRSAFLAEAACRFIDYLTPRSRPIKAQSKLTYEEQHLLYYGVPPLPIPKKKK